MDARNDDWLKSWRRSDCLRCGALIFDAIDTAGLSDAVVSRLSLYCVKCAQKLAGEPLKGLCSNRQKE